MTLTKQYIDEINKYIMIKNSSKLTYTTPTVVSIAMYANTALNNCNIQPVLIQCSISILPKNVKK